MKKSLLTSLSAAALLWTLSAPALAQTCIKTPTCADLGYSQTAADCAGKTILKCPLDTSKLYCPSDTETLRNYKVGDSYVDKNGIGIGKIISVDSSGLHGVIVIAGGSGDGATATTSCTARTAGGLNWSLASGKNACLIDKGASCCGCTLRSASGNGYCTTSSWSTYDTNCQDPNLALGFYCEAPF